MITSMTVREPDGSCITTEIEGTRRCLLEEFADICANLIENGISAEDLTEIIREV